VVCPTGCTHSPQKSKNLDWQTTKNDGLPHGKTSMIFAAIAYLAFAVFVAGMVWRAAAWVRVPVPFRNRSPWAGALLSHGCLLWVVAGHLRFFLEPALLGPANRFVDAGLLLALVFLFLRRVLDPRLRFVTADYLPLALLATVAGSGVLTRTPAPPRISSTSACQTRAPGNRRTPIGSFPKTGATSYSMACATAWRNTARSEAYGVNLLACICAIDKATFPKLLDYWVGGVEVAGVHELVGNALVMKGEKPRHTDLRGEAHD
jgi:hypothetical protein